MTKKKVVTEREILVDCDIDTATTVTDLAQIGMDEGDSLSGWLARETGHGERAGDFARGMGMLDDLTLYFQLVEHYDDGSQKVVERMTWRDHG